MMFKPKLRLEADDDQRVLNVFFILLLALIIWSSYFHSYQQFSLYWEDFKRIPTSMQWNWAQIGKLWLEVPTVIGEEEGRPLHPGLIYLFSHLGMQLGGLSAMYVIAYLINLLNALLFYKLMQRSTRQPFFALTSTLGFALFPVDANHAWLTSAFGVLPALTLLLVALHLYLTNGRRNIFLSYLSIFVSVFCYEKFLPLFWAAPLLKSSWRWNMRSGRELFRHTAILISLLFMTLLIRKLSGEGRVNRLLDADGLLQVVLSITTGPIVTIKTFVLKPIQALMMLKVEWIIPLSLVLVAIAYCLHYSKLFNSTELLPIERISRQSKRDFFSLLLRLSVVGFVELILAYILSLTGSAKEVYHVNGRDSLIHVAAIFGAAVLCGCVCFLTDFVASLYQKSSIAIFGSALFFTLLIASGFTVQQEFVSVAQYQRAFWTDVSRLCPDMTRKTIILIDFNHDPEGIERSLSFSRQFPHILGYIYKFPNRWTNEDFQQAAQPKTYRLDIGWQDKIEFDDSFLKITSDLTVDGRDLPGKVKSINVILLRSQNGQLSRQSDPLTLDSKTFPLKQNKTLLKLPPFKPNVLFNKLIRVAG